MGKEGMVGGQLKKALKSGHQSVEKYTSKMMEQNEAMIDRLNWVMKVQQQIADHLKIKLDDPLELDEEDDGGKK